MYGENYNPIYEVTLKTDMERGFGPLSPPFRRLSRAIHLLKCLIAVYSLIEQSGYIEEWIARLILYSNKIVIVIEITKMFSHRAKLCKLDLIANTVHFNFGQSFVDMLSYI